MHRELIHYKPVKEAKSTPILFIHGAWHGAWCWEGHFLPYFAAKGYDSYALSLRGHGNSEGREGLRWWSISDYVEDVSHVISQLPETPVLVGHSMGGLIIQKYLEKQRAPLAILLAPVPITGVLNTTLRIALRHFPILLKVLSSFSLYHVVCTPELARESFFSSDIPEEKLDKYFRLLQDESFRGFLDMTFSLPRPKKVRDTVSLIGARDDNIFTVKQMEKTARAYHGKAVIFNNMAHDMMLEKGWQDVAEHILSCLKAHNL